MKNKFDFQPKLVSALKNYSKEKFMTDLMAGIIVGIVALPLAIAFGIASGVSPEKGLITAILGGFFVSLLGGCNVQIGGPTGAFIVIVYGIIQNFGIEGLAIATVVAGIILVIMGALKLGTVIKFIPYPIVVGFTSGIALTIFTTQMKDLFGLTMDKVPADFISKWIAYFEHFDTMNLWSLLIGLTSIVIIAITPKFSKKIPGSLIAIILMTVVVYVMRYHLGITGIETIGDRFTINASLPGPETINFNMETINLLLPSAFTIAMLGAIESLLSATVADGVTGDKHNSNTELIGQGIANMEMSARNKEVVSSFPIEDDNQIMMVTDGGKLIRMPVTDIRIAGRKTQGVILFRTADDENVVSVTKLDADDGSEDEIDSDENTSEEMIVSDENYHSSLRYGAIWRRKSFI